MAKKEEQFELFIDDRSIALSSASPVCTSCVHLLDPSMHTCQAFIKIPDVIWDGKIKHRELYKGDGGILYRRITEDELDQQLAEAKSLLT